MNLREAPAPLRRHPPRETGFHGMTPPDNNDRSLLQLGRDALESGDFQAAAEAYRRALQENPDDPNALCDLGIALMRLGQWAAAADATESFLRSCPKDIMGWIRLGMNRREAGDLQKGKDAIKRALRLEPGHPIAWKELGVCYLAQGKIDQGRESLRRALDVKPSYVAACCALGETYEAEGETSRAMKIYMRGLDATRSEKRGPLYARLGPVFAGIERWDDARVAYSKAISKGESDPNLRIELGKVCLRLGLVDLAEVQCKILVTLGSGLAVELRQLIEEKTGQRDAAPMARRPLKPAPANAKAPKAPAAPPPSDASQSDDAGLPPLRTRRSDPNTEQAVPAPLSDSSSGDDQSAFESFFHSSLEDSGIRPLKPGPESPNEPSLDELLSMLSGPSVVPAASADSEPPPPPPSSIAASAAKPEPKIEAPAAKAPAPKASEKDPFAFDSVIDSESNLEAVRAFDPDGGAQASNIPDPKAFDGPDAGVPEVALAASEIPPPPEPEAPSEPPAPNPEEETSAPPPPPAPGEWEGLDPTAAAEDPTLPLYWAREGSLPVNRSIGSLFEIMSKRGKRPGACLGIAARLALPVERSGQIVLAPIFPEKPELGQIYTQLFAPGDASQESLHVEILRGCPLSPIAECKAVIGFDLPIPPRADPTESIEISFTNAEADLVRITLRDLFTGEQIESALQIET